MYPNEIKKFIDVIEGNALLPNRDNIISQIAKEHLFIETLQTRNRDSLDFHDVSVWSVKNALEAAYEAGKQAGKKQS